MEFGEIAIMDAEGAILAHSQKVGGKRFGKGRVLSDDDIAALRAYGITRVVVARLGKQDVHENAAAARLARACSGPSLQPGTAGTGRVNLFAQEDGLALYEPDSLHAVNMVDESMTVAAVPPFERVAAGQIVATCKIIPFGVPDADISRVEATVKQSKGPLFRLAPFSPLSIGLIQTTLPGTAEKVLEKTLKTVTDRVEGLGSHLAKTQTVSHTDSDVARALEVMTDAGCDITLIVGASATTDRRDTIPAGINLAAGEIRHFGMPVDPGNLLVLGHIGPMSVLGLPGSARSPKTGGNDWILWRLCARLSVESRDIMRLGARGLLKEIPARPLPREEAAPARPRSSRAPRRIAAIVLAAGQSRRMGEKNKLLEHVAGKPLIRHSVEAAVTSNADPVIVVTASPSNEIRDAIADLPVSLASNPAPECGMATSIRSGIDALPHDIDGTLIILADMPAIAVSTINRLIETFDPASGSTICVPEHKGERGHPVLFARRFFPELKHLHGDTGAKPVIQEFTDQVLIVPVHDVGIGIDLDTPDAFERYHSRSEQSR